MRAVTAARLRRRGGTAEAVAADSGGDSVGEREQIVEELTAVRFEAARRRGAELDGDRPWLPRSELDSVGVGHGRARGGMDELRGEVAQLRAR